jgi:alpha-tubulin suppressor-like RCC1 family protein
MKSLMSYFISKLCFLLLSVMCIPSLSLGQTTKLIAVAGGERHSVALKEDGTVWAWGANGSGQVGNGDVGEDKLNPVQVIELTGYLTDITAIAAGTSYWLNQGGHSLALRNDGTVRTWGYGLDGQLGDGTSGWPESKNTPVQVLDLSDPTNWLCLFLLQKCPYKVFYTILFKSWNYCYACLHYEGRNF